MPYFGFQGWTGFPRNGRWVGARSSSLTASLFHPRRCTRDQPGPREALADWVPTRSVGSGPPVHATASTQTVPDAGGPSLYVMTETDKGLGVSGRVAQKVMLRPRKRAADAASESAARPVAQRPKTEAAAPMLHMGSLDEGPTVTNTHIFAQRGWYERHKQAMAEAMEEEEQAQKLDRPALERAVFAAFTRQRFWKMVQLSSYLKQPVNEVRDRRLSRMRCRAWVRLSHRPSPRPQVLREVAVRHTVGPHAGEWELKPEFRAR